MAEYVDSEGNPINPDGSEKKPDSSEKKATRSRKKGSKKTGSEPLYLSPDWLYKKLVTALQPKKAPRTAR